VDLPQPMADQYIKFTVIDCQIQVLNHGSFFAQKTWSDFSIQ
jgi:hypothetical protein